MTPHGVLDLRDLPWWTTADRAEFDVLIRALIKGIDWHLARCPIAATNEASGEYHWCKHLSAAVEEVVEWRDMREAVSRARWLRLMITAREEHALCRATSTRSTSRT